MLYSEMLFLWHHAFCCHYLQLIFCFAFCSSFITLPVYCKSICHLDNLHVQLWLSCLTEWRSPVFPTSTSLDLSWDTPFRNTKVQWFCGGDMPRYSAGTTFHISTIRETKGKEKKTASLHGKLTLGRKKH